MRRFSIGFLIIAPIFLFAYSQIKIANLPPIPSVAYKELQKHPEERRLIVSEALCSVYPVGSDKQAVVDDWINSECSEAVIIEDGVESYYGRESFMLSLAGPIMHRDSAVSIKVQFDDDKLAEIEAYVFR